MAMDIEISKDRISNTMSITDIRQMITDLGRTENGEELKNAMTQLKEALRFNPDACALMLPEDIGQCAHYLKKLTGQQISNEAMGLAGKKKRAPKVFDPAVEKAIEDMLFDGK